MTTVLDRAGFAAEKSNLAVSEAGFAPSVSAAAKFTPQKCESITDHLMNLKSEGHASMKNYAVWNEAPLAIVTKDDGIFLKSPDGTLFAADKAQFSGILKPGRNKQELAVGQILASVLLDEGQAVLVQIGTDHDAKHNENNPGSRISVLPMPDKAADGKITELAAIRTRAMHGAAMANGA